MRALESRTALPRLIALVLGFAAMCPLASSYSHWIFLPTSTAPFAPVPGRFDLTALTDNTVNYFISDQGPAALMPGDSLTAIYSQIQSAAKVWNSVPTSAVRLHFGGVAPIGTPQTTPGIDVVFDDALPPGILAQTRPTFPADLSFLTAKGANFVPPAFVPLLRSKVQLPSTLSAAAVQQSSYTDSFFLTLVHELGHAVGLQHSMTSAVMSTAVTRATMKGAPLAADDISSVSQLYPVAGYTASTGSIAGTVTLAGAGANMASVVALSVSSGTAVGALTNPDGTYRIDGLPTDQYLVYVHPLPPAQLGEASPANIVPPVDAAGNSYPANIGFDTSFFPGTKDWTKAAAIAVVAGSSTGLVNFAVAARPGPAVYGMQTYGYINGAAVAEPPMLSGTLGNPLVFYAPGTTVNKQTAIAPGLNVSVIGGAASIQAGTLQYYTEGFLLMYVDAATVTAPAPTALAVTLGNDLYVLPQAFTVEAVAPPAIAQVTPGTAADGTAFATLAGSNLSAASRIVFDGAQAAIQSVNADGSLVVIPPPAPSGYLATVEALNPEGQTSLQSIGTAAVPEYAYGVSNATSMSVQPASVTAGTDTMLTISGANTHFAEGQSVVGTGTSDIVVRRAWVVNPGQILVNATVGAGANSGPVNLTVSTGLEVVTLAAAISVQASGAQQSSLRVPVVSTVTGLAGVPIGGTLSLNATGLPANLAGWTLTVGGVSTPFGVTPSGILTALVPAGVGLGAEILQLTAPGGGGPSPVVMQVDAPPPVIAAAVDDAGPVGTSYPVSPSAPANPGDAVALLVSGLAGSAPALPTPDQVWISAGGIFVRSNSVVAVDNNVARVQFVLPTALPYNSTTTLQTVPIAIGVGTRLSAAYGLAVRVNPPASPAPAQ